jgi:hypothetical protein
LRLLRSPVLMEEVYQLNDPDWYPRRPVNKWSSRPVNEWSSQVSGRNTNCEPNRVTASG